MTRALHTLSLDELAARLRNREYSSVELTRYYLERIKALDGSLNSFVTLTEELALKQAEAADRRLADGTAGRLTGVPLAEKDLFCTAGVRTTCGSRMLESFVAPYDATVVERLHGSAPGFGGMPLLGKLNMDEFAMGSSNETSHFGRVANPWDLGRVPGGSSGGSAAAVAAGLTPAATATDTGGSIRQPAAFANLTGIKPTYGRVSRFGMIAFASSLDQGGVLARSALDCALLLSEMAGFDPRDSTCLEMPREDFTGSFHAPVAGLKIGLPKEFFGPGMTDAVRQRVDAAIEVYKKLGAEIVEISLPDVGLSVPVYYVVAPAEASSNLARYDGVRYGHRAAEPKNLEDLYARSRAEGFGPEVQRRIMIGTYVLSHGYFDAYYLKAQRVRAKIAADFDAAFKQVDFILSPSTTDVAFPFGQNSDDPVQMYLNDIFTIAANLAGLPAMSVPAGFAADSGLPVGFQLMGPALSEGRLLGLAHAFQRETDFHRRWAEGYA